MVSYSRIPGTRTDYGRFGRFGKLSEIGDSHLFYGFGITPGSPNGPTGGTSTTSGPTYNAFGQVVSLTDADGGVTSFTKDRRIN